VIRRNRSNLIPDAPRRPGGKRKTKPVRDWLILGDWPEGLVIHTGKRGRPENGFDKKAYDRAYAKARRARIKAAGNA